MLSRIIHGISIMNKFSKTNIGFIAFLLVFLLSSSSAKAFSFEKSLDSATALTNNSENTCPIVLFIEPLATICIDSTINPFPLMVTIQGSDGTGFGVWSGPGIIDPIFYIHSGIVPEVSNLRSILLFRNVVIGRSKRIKEQSGLSNLTFVQVDVAAATDVMYLIDKVAAGYKRERIGEYNENDMPTGILDGIDFDEELDEDEWEEDDLDFFSN